MASKWLKDLPSTKNMLSNKKKINDEDNTVKMTLFKKYIASHDTNPLVVLTTSGTTELIRNLEAKKRTKNTNKLKKKRTAESSTLDNQDNSISNKKQKIKKPDLIICNLLSEEVCYSAFSLLHHRGFGDGRRDTAASPPPPCGRSCVRG